MIHYFYRDSSDAYDWAARNGVGVTILLNPGLGLTFPGVKIGWIPAFEFSAHRWKETTQEKFEEACNNTLSAVRAMMAQMGVVAE